MIEEAYVSFEVAKLLKEKGFEGSCHYFRDICEKTFSETWNTESHISIGIPTLQMACRWLREIHKVFIIIDYDEDEDCEDNERYGFTVYQNNKSKIDLATYVTYEEAVEAALKYVLENLI